MIKAYIQSFLAFVKSVFSEGGEGSYSRVAGGVLIGFTCGWITYLVIKNHAMPDLTGPAWFVTAASGGLYGLNKGADFISAFKGK
jgi:hypothetical protein